MWAPKVELHARQGSTCSAERLEGVKASSLGKASAWSTLFLQQKQDVPQINVNAARIGLEGPVGGDGFVCAVEREAHELAARV